MQTLHNWRNKKNDIKILHLRLEAAIYVFYTKKTKNNEKDSDVSVVIEKLKGKKTQFMAYREQ